MTGFVFGTVSAESEYVASGVLAPASYDCSLAPLSTTPSELNTRCRASGERAAMVIMVLHSASRCRGGNGYPVSASAACPLGRLLLFGGGTSNSIVPVMSGGRRMRNGQDSLGPKRASGVAVRTP